MGCGNSKLGASGAAIPQRLCSIFYGQIDQDIKRRHARTHKDDQPSSKKVLLLHGRDDDDDDTSSSHQPFVNNTQKKNSSLLDDQDSNSCVTISDHQRDLDKKRINGNSQRDDEEARREANSKDDESSNHFCNDNNNYECEGKLSEAKTTKEKANMNNGKIDADHVEDEGDEDDDNDDDERRLKRDDEYAFPGSPSFRVYFAENSQDQRNINDIDNGLKETAPSKVVAIEKECSPQEVKKERKRKGFRQILTKGGIFNTRS